MTNLVEDIAKLTDVPDKTLQKFTPLINYCLGHALHESQCNRKDLTEIDLGYGILQLKVETNGLRYKFIPSNDLEKLLIETLKSRCSPIITKLDRDLQEKIERAYKELL